MTAPAKLKQADLKRLAAVAKSEGVRIKVEIDGMTIEISPDSEVVKPATLSGREIDL